MSFRRPTQFSRRHPRSEGTSAAAGFNPQPEVGRVTPCAPRACDVTDGAHGVTRPTSRGKDGVALVVTLIMLALITFLAVAFLAVSRRERASVNTTIEQTDTLLAADTARERAITEIVAEILARTNPFYAGPLVSQNYINPLGFVPNPLAASSDPTNVNYEFVMPPNLPPTGPMTRLNNDQRLQNIANLLYDPRPPVYVTNPVTGTTDFRFYHDLNRNGQFDPTGLQPVIAPNGNYYDTNGNAVLAVDTNSFPPLTVLSNWFLGDPHWIGILQHPEWPHSPSNFFTSRYAFLVLPYGNTLDVNASHNQSLGAANRQLPPLGNFFRRNQGPGTWEINLAAFLHDLNTNSFAWGFPNGYTYNPLIGLPQVTGKSFEDAAAILSFRYDRDYANLRSVEQLYGGLGSALFRTDGIDGYSDLPLSLDLSPLDESVVANQDRPNQPWLGDDSPNRLFTHQDFFDVAKVGQQFVNRLMTAGTANSTHDRNTFYRMISQLGLDSPTDARQRIHLNYDNKVRANNLGIRSPTNFFEWQPLALFTNAVDAMLERSGYGFTSTNIPVGHVFTNTVTGSNEWVWDYSPSINRILQLAANIVDARTNRTDRLVFAGDSVRRPIYAPTVFKPVFTNINNGERIRIAGFEEVRDFALAQNNPLYSLPLDVGNEAVRANLQPTNNIFGVPIILGAKKGLPSFNEYSMQTVAAVTRRLELHRRDRNSLPYQTNQMYVVDIHGEAQLEAWNSYTSTFPVQVEMYAYNVTSLALTNSRTATVLRSFAESTSMTIPANTWQGFQRAPGTPSFRIPLRNSFVLASNAVWRAVDAPLGLHQDLNFGFESGREYPVPDFGLLVTNNLRFFIIAPNGPGGQPLLLDYVQLNNLGTTRSIGSELLSGPEALVVSWLTNRVGGNTVRNPTEGIINQISISSGNPVSGFPRDGEWTDYGIEPSGASKKLAIDAFRVFLGLSPIYFPGTENSSLNHMQAPFSPSRKTSQYQTWQANDPLVHYMEGDLRDVRRTNVIDFIIPPTAETNALDNIGQINDRYLPWGGNPRKSTDPNSYNLALKDALVSRSDDWQFPTNKLPNIGWLGRVHRGTPWQTVYLKSQQAELREWVRHAGSAGQYFPVSSAVNARLRSLFGTNSVPASGGVEDALLTHPWNDHDLLDLFTVALNDNATRGQLSVNQTNLASLSAVLSGVIALTNTVPNPDLTSSPFPLVQTAPAIVEPVGVDPGISPLFQIYTNINRVRAQQPDGRFEYMGRVLQAPALTVDSPYLNTSDIQREKGIPDDLYERIPQMVLSLLKTGDPRFVVYSYGQSLKPAERSIVQSGQYFGMCTNYQITGETVTRTIVRIEGPPDRPVAVIESYDVLAPE